MNNLFIHIARKAFCLAATCLVAGAMFNPQPAHAAEQQIPSRPGKFKFDRTISREVLENYLSRSITMEGLLNGRGDLDDNIRMLKSIGAKFIGRSLCLWGGEANLLQNLERAKQQIPKVHAADSEMILQACIFEIVTTQVDQVPVPDWVFAALGQPVENRNFRYADMLYPSGRFKDHWRTGQSVPDVSRPETKLWFYYLGASFIDAGCEAIHLGQTELMNHNDRNLDHYSQVLTLIRSHAAKHARRHMALLDSHVPSGGLVRDGQLLMDFHSFPLRIMETPDKPQEAILKVGFSDGIYGRSKGGMTFSGWRCEHLPYLVEIDNWGVSRQPGQPNVGGIWIWGYDEITWFAHQSREYRANWLRYAWDWVRRTDANGFLEMPGSRTLRSPLDNMRWYYANNPSPAVPDGFGDEEAIRAIWAADSTDGFEETTKGAGQYFKVDYPASTAPDELQIAVTYTLWIPDGAARLRGIIVHQHGAGTTASIEGSTAPYDLHWQALAKKWDCALFGSSYHVLNEAIDLTPGGSEHWFDPRRGSEKTFLKALGEFAAKSGHPELATVPWALWGHSGGGIWADVMTTLHPERVAAVWLRSGSAAMFRSKPEFPQPQIPDAAYAVPTMCNPGVKEKPNSPWRGPLATFQEYRAKGAPIGFAPDPRTGHECGDCRYLAIPFFDACLAMRLPDKGSQDQTLKPVDMSQAWLAPLLGEVAQPAAVFQGNPNEAVWLPNAVVAKAWMEYVRTGAVSDTTPPPAPFDVRVSPKGELGNEIVWNAEADFESGIGHFIVLRDGQELANVPQKPVGKFGRPLFQSMTYHDTPSQPMPAMRYLDASAKPGEKHNYAVITVNSVGLKSALAVESSKGAAGR